MAAKNCVRCGAEAFGLVRSEADIHVCKDVAKRLARQERQIEAVVGILQQHDLSSRERRLAELIVRRLNQLGIADD